MKVCTIALIPAPSKEVWPLLCHSKMDNSFSWLFLLGLPRPVECKIDSVKGEVGANRQCVSDRGMITQQITVWDEPNLLEFEMKSTNLYFYPWILWMKDKFSLLENEHFQTQITRTTEFEIRGRFKFIKKILLFIGLKKIHRYVFSNFIKLSRLPNDIYDDTYASSHFKTPEKSSGGKKK